MTPWNGIQLKQLKIGPLELRFRLSMENCCAIAVIVLGAVIRILLISQGWPISDPATALSSRAMSKLPAALWTSNSISQATATDPTEPPYKGTRNRATFTLLALSRQIISSNIMPLRAEHFSA